MMGLRERSGQQSAPPGVAHHLCAATVHGAQTPCVVKGSGCLSWVADARGASKVPADREIVGMGVPLAPRWGAASCAE